MKRNQIITLSLLTLIMIAATLGLETARNARESALAAPEPPTLAPTLAIGTSHDPVDQQDADADNEEPSSLAQPEAPSASQESLTGMYTPIAEADSGDAPVDLPGSTALPTRTPGGNTALPTRTPVANPTSAAPPTRTPGANPTSPPPVSYTHLDVYKRQAWQRKKPVCCRGCLEKRPPTWHST